MKQKLKNTIEINQKNKIYVGADDHVRPLLKRNTQKGITLVALVITIIVLLILAVVSIRIAINGGLATKAKEATERNTKETEKEAIQTDYASYKISRLTNPKEAFTIENARITSVEVGWRIEFYETGNVYTLYTNGKIEELDKETSNAPDELVAYLIGDKGKKLEEIINTDNMKFIDDPNTISNASTSLIFCGISGGSSNYGATDACIHFKYKNNSYKLKFDYEMSDNNFTMYTATVNLVNSLKGLEGKKATYNGNEYTILYDNEDGTVEMISDNTMGELTLGYEDKEAKGNDDYEKAVYSYNNLVTRLNNYCASFYKGDSNVISVRNVGSDPNNHNNENSNLCTNDLLQENKYTYNKKQVRVDGILKSSDKNYKDDIDKLVEIGNSSTNDNKSYFLASRATLFGTDYIEFYIRIFASAWSGFDEWSLLDFTQQGGSEDNVDIRNQSQPVRPVIKISTSAIQIQE